MYSTAEVALLAITDGTPLSSRRSAFNGYDVVPLSTFVSEIDAPRMRSRESGFSNYHHIR